MADPSVLDSARLAPPSRLGVVGQALRAVFPAWCVTRLLVAAAFVISHLLVRTARPNDPKAAGTLARGLSAWDAGWYRSIAEFGYRSSGAHSLRFFPGYPLAGRYLGVLLDIGPGTALIVLANACALVAMAVLWLLVRNELGDLDLARRSVWLLAVCPSSYTLVMGYADASFLLASLLVFLAARSGHWWWAAVAGLMAGAVRPVGLLLVLPMAVEIWQQHGRHREARLPWAAVTAALFAPVLGTALFLAWVGHVFHDPWLPYRLQMHAGHSGSILAPVASLWNATASSVRGHHLGTALHLPWVLLALALLVVAFRRLPLSYAVYAASTLCVLLATSNLDSFERYAMDAFPLVIAGGTLLVPKGVERGILVSAGVVLVGYTVLASWAMVVP